MQWQNTIYTRWLVWDSMTRSVQNQFHILKWLTQSLLIALAWLINVDEGKLKKIDERIDSETRNIKAFIDETVTGFVELKDDLMWVNQDEYISTKLKYGNDIAGTSDCASDIHLTCPAVLTNGNSDWAALSQLLFTKIIRKFN